MSERIKPALASMAAEFGFVGSSSFSFLFSDIVGTRTPSYNPDCVWFQEQAVESNTFAVFEIDENPSRKHRVGGVALANVTALKLSKRLHYFAIVPPAREKLAKSCIDILRNYLGDKWLLEAIVIPSFDPKVIRQQISLLDLKS